MLYCALIRSSTTTLTSYVKTSTGYVVSLTMGSGQTAGDAMSSTNTDSCGGGQVLKLITVLSTVNFTPESDWVLVAAQSLYGTLEFTLDCNTIPTIGIIGSGVSAVTAV